MIYDKETVEQFPLGKCNIYIPEPNEWTPEISQALNEGVSHVVRISEESKIYFQPLRLIVFAPQYEEEVIKWQKMINGYSDGITNTPVAKGGAITLTWSKDSEFYAIIIMMEGIGVGLALKQPLACSILCHELTHVNFNYLEFLHQQESTPTPLDNWGNTKLSLAKSLLSEFIAEFHSSMFLQDRTNETEKLTIDMLTYSIEQIQLKKESFNITISIAELWNFSLTKMSEVYAQFGRVLGILNANNPDELEIFIKDVTSVSAIWGNLVQDLHEQIILCFKSFSINELSGICSVVEKGFNIIGLFPTSTEEGLFVNVR